MARKSTTRKPTPAQIEQELAAAGVHIPSKEQVDREAAEAMAEEAANLAREAEEMAEEAAKPAKRAKTYTGPMLILRERLKAGAYGKMANGQPACGDQLAQMLGALNSQQVIRACMIAMAIDINPYAHLNVGQQSMNLRNKLRGMLKQGLFGYGVVAEAVEDVIEPVADVDQDPTSIDAEEMDEPQNAE